MNTINWYYYYYLYQVLLKNWNNIRELYLNLPISITLKTAWIFMISNCIHVGNFRCYWFQNLSPNIPFSHWPWIFTVWIKEDSYLHMHNLHYAKLVLEGQNELIHILWVIYQQFLVTLWLYLQNEYIIWWLPVSPNVIKLNFLVETSGAINHFSSLHSVPLLLAM